MSLQKQQKKSFFFFFTWDSKFCTVYYAGLGDEPEEAALVFRLSVRGLREGPGGRSFVKWSVRMSCDSGICASSGENRGDETCESSVEEDTVEEDRDRLESENAHRKCS